MTPALPFRLVSEEPGPRFLGLTAAERNMRVAHRVTPSWVTNPPSPANLDALPTLTIPPGVIITPALVTALPAPGGTWHLVWDPARPPIVWTVTGAAHAGPAATTPVPEGAALDISTSAARRRSAWRLLRASGKKTDRWIARYIHRKISRLFSYALLQLGLTPNIATFLTFLVGVACAWLLAQTSYETMILGALLFWFASVADGIDGEMARLTLRESDWGERLDTAVDQVTYLVAYAGLMIGCWRQGIDRAGWALLIGVAIGVPLLLYWGVRLMRRARGVHEDVFIDKPIEVGVAGAAADTGAPALRLASGLFTLFRRESFSIAFFLVSLLAGQRIVIPAMLAGGMIVVLATLVIYRDPIERAMRARYVAAAASEDRAAASTMAVSNSISPTR
jgi:1L-myo-inositol 1-phosphate cytidylyltransferase / CDP-L-myo-inositol myo-inositolphosphotransferase